MIRLCRNLPLPLWVYPLLVCLSPFIVAAFFPHGFSPGPLPGWVEYMPPSREFFVRFPGVPVETKSDEIVYDEVVRSWTYTSADGAGRSHAVQVSRYPMMSVDKVASDWLLDLDRDALAYSLRATPEHEARLTVNDCPARELRLRRDNEIIRVRIVQSIGTVFRVMVSAPVGDAALGEEAERYFASFEIPRRVYEDDRWQFQKDDDGLAALLAELDNFKGTWKLVVVTEKGAERKPDAETTLTVDDDQYVFKQEGRDAFRGKLNVDPGKKILALHNGDGAELLRATYRLDGDSLTLTFDGGDVSRFRR